MQNPMQTCQMWGHHNGASKSSLTLCVAGNLQHATSIWSMQRHFSLSLLKLCEKHESFIMRMILSEKIKKKTSFTTWGPTLNQKWLFEGVPRFPGTVMINAAAMYFINVSAVDWAYGFTVREENKKSEKKLIELLDLVRPFFMCSRK